MEAESFDKKIRDLFESAEFPYQEADWQKAQKLLQQERRRKAIGWLWLLPFVAVGTSWWMLLANEPDKSTFEQLAILPTHESATAQASAAASNFAENAAEIAAENADLQSGIALRTQNTGNISTIAAHKDPISQQNMLINHVKETNEGTESSELLMLEAKSALLEPVKLTASSPEKRADEPLSFERPKIKQAPVFALGFWAATQPVWNTGREKSAGRLNLQTGIMASIQWQNGLYGQWLGGLQQQQLRNWTYTNNNTTYDFGFERTTQTLDLRNYWSMQNSLRLGYQKGSHRIFGSITHQHYLFSQYRLSTERARQDVPPTVEKQLGMAAWQQAEIPNWLPGLGYEYSPNQTFHLGVMYQFRPAQPSDANLPNAGAWQFSLQYVLFQRQKP